MLWISSYSYLSNQNKERDLVHWTSFLIPTPSLHTLIDHWTSISPGHLHALLVNLQSNCSHHHNIELHGNQITCSDKRKWQLEWIWVEAKKEKKDKHALTLELVTSLTSNFFTSLVRCIRRCLYAQHKLVEVVLYR